MNLSSLFVLNSGNLITFLSQHHDDLVCFSDGTWQLPLAAVHFVYLYHYISLCLLCDISLSYRKNINPLWTQKALIEHFFNYFFYFAWIHFREFTIFDRYSSLPGEWGDIYQLCNIDGCLQLTLARSPQHSCSAAKSVFQVAARSHWGWETSA